MRGYWLSEKLDGIRAEWTGRQLVSRNRNTFAAPQWFLDGLPTVPVSGELYLGPGTLDECQSVVRSRFGDWHRVRFYLFDMQREFGPFADRVAKLRALTLPDWCEVIPQRICRGDADAERAFRQVTSRGGEGVILRSPWSELERPREIIKLKRSQTELRSGRYACELV